MISLELPLKVLGWIFVLVPTVTFLSISFHMIRGAAKDDSTIQALALIALTVFFMGSVILLLLYLTDIFQTL